MNLKTIDFSTTKEFEANGVKYYVENTLSFDRYLNYQLIQVECGYDTSFKGLFDNVKKAYEHANKLELAKACVVLHNILTGISKVEERKIPVLQMCALFINEKEEDRRIITNEMVDKKIENWTKEGLDIVPFFHLALSSISNFSNAWEEVSRNISIPGSQSKK